MNSQGNAKIVRRSTSQAASLPRGRVISPRRESEQVPVAVPAQASAVDRYQSLKRRYGQQALAVFVFLVAAAYMGTRPLDPLPQAISLDDVSGNTEVSSTDSDAIAQAYARFGEEVRDEARKHAAEIRLALAARQNQTPDAPVAHTFAPTYSRPALVGKVFKIIKRYAPRHRDPQALAEAIVSEAEAQNYDALFVAAVIKSESAFNALARSHKGAQGLMQIMPATGKWLAQEASVPRGNLTDPGHNLELGVRYLKQLEAQYGGDRVFTLIAYNWGPGHVESATDGKRRIPPEVVTYAIKILNDYRRWRSGR